MSIMEINMLKEEKNIASPLAFEYVITLHVQYATFHIANISCIGAWTLTFYSSPWFANCENQFS